jgi:ankyrin repeat protein
MEAAWEHAVTHGDVGGVRELLAGGVNVNAQNRYGQTALMREIIELLAAREAQLAREQ